MDLLGRVLLARYRLDAKLGAGGSAEVYAARDLQLERRVAVKVLHPGLADDARFRRRFSAEATSAAQLSHPGIVGVYDSGCDGVPYIVMELVDGGSLQDVLDEGRTLSPAQAAALGAEVATALAYAHRRGVVHRDLKPGNILLTAEGRAKVADFGIARAMADAQWTEPLVVLGTARYTPPEALEGEAYTPAGDVYSLGLVLAEAVAGVPVFNAETPVAVLAGRLRARTPLPDCGPLQPVLETATATDPTDRYPDAHSLEVELAPLATGAEPIAPAGRASGRGGPHTEALPAHISRKRNRRRRRRLLALLAVIVVIAAAVPLWVFVAGARTVGVFRGLPLAEATADLGDLAVTVAPAVPDNTIPAGRVLSQDPPPGTRVRWRGRVTLVPSAGLPPVAVPSLVGLTLTDAASRLNEAHLRVGKVDAVDNDAPAWQVISQDQGQRPQGAAVAVTVSSGLPVTAVVPKVEGRTLDDATAVLQQARLAVATTDEFSDTVPEGTVITQDIGEAARVRPGRIVTLTVSKGPELVTVPKLATLPVDDAIAQLEALGLQVSVTQVDMRRFVLDTTPVAGTRVKKGSTVVVYTA